MFLYNLGRDSVVIPARTHELNHSIRFGTVSTNLPQHLMRRFRDRTEDENEVERIRKRELVWIIANFVSGSFGTIALLFLDFDWSMLVGFQNIFYLLFVYDHIYLYWKLDPKRNEKDKVIRSCIYKQFASLVLVAASRTVLSSLPLLPSLLEVIAMLLVCNC